MDSPAEVVFRNVKGTPELEALIHERVARLEHFYKHIIGCRVTVELQNKTHRSGNVPDVHIDIQVPGQSLVVTHRRPGADAMTAVHNAFDAAALQLKEYKERRIGNVKRHGAADDLSAETAPSSPVGG